MILGGGPGNDLRPLTDVRAEPAMPFAGTFRLVDIPISNCINSGARQMPPPLNTHTHIHTYMQNMFPHPAATPRAMGHGACLAVG